MRKVLVLSTTMLLVVGLLLVGFSCQKEEEKTDEVVEATPTVTATSTPTPTATPTPTQTPIVSSTTTGPGTYINEMFGYKITLPDGYTAKVHENRTDDPNRFDQDKLEIKDPSGNLFATIWTPLLETGFENTEVEEEKTISVPGSSTTLSWDKRVAVEGASFEGGTVVVTWGFSPEADFEETGMILHSFDSADDPSIETFEEMVRTLRFI